jgi:hypothetical protein
MNRLIRSCIFLACTLLFFGMAQGEGDLLPRGFASAGTPQRYGLPERQLASGTIFNYMNGGGVVYLEHGFQKLAHREFSNPDKRIITFDHFTMGTEAQAVAALTDERIAPAGGSPLALNVPNKSYRFPPDYFVYIVQGRNLIYLHVDDDRLAGILDQFAVDILKSPTEEKE